MSAKVVAALLALLLLAGCQTQLFGDLSESEANAVMAVLLEASIAAEKKAGAESTYSIFVDEGDFARAMRLLDAAALPGRKFDDLGKVFGSEAMFSSPMEEKARYLHAMQEELSKTISEIDGVLTARVHLVFPEQDQLGREIHSPSAAVMIRHTDDERYDPAFFQNSVRRLLASSVPNLEESAIAVTFFPVQPPKASAAPAFQTVLGVGVRESDASRLRGILGIVAGVCLVFAGVTAYVLVRARKGKKDGSS